MTVLYQLNASIETGEWISPTVIGDRPLPISYFTLNQLSNDRSKAILFGGMITPEKNKYHCSNDTYMLSLTSDTVVSGYSRLTVGACTVFFHV